MISGEERTGRGKDAPQSSQTPNQKPKKKKKPDAEGIQGRWESGLEYFKISCAVGFCFSPRRYPALVDRTLTFSFKFRRERARERARYGLVLHPDRSSCDNVLSFCPPSIDADRIKSGDWSNGSTGLAELLACVSHHLTHTTLPSIADLALLLKPVVHMQEGIVHLVILFILAQ